MRLLGLRIIDSPQCYKQEGLIENTDAGFHICTKKRIGTVFCVASCVLLCCTLSVLVYTLSLMRALEDRMSHLEDTQDVCSQCVSNMMEKQQMYLNAAQDQTKTEPKIKRKRNTAGHQPRFVHLVGKGLSDYSTHVGNVTVFKWNRTEHYRRPQGITLHPNADDIMRIRISTTGTYLVYAQVGLNGKTNLDAHYYCAHRTILRKASGSSSPILSSALTQDNRGRRYRDIIPDDTFKPIDTQMHMGVFWLLPNDELEVQKSPLCTGSDYSMTAENAYFGVVKLS